MRITKYLFISNLSGSSKSHVCDLTGGTISDGLVTGEEGEQSHKKQNQLASSSTMMSNKISTMIAGMVACKL